MVYRSAVCTVEYATCLDGSMPAKEFYEALPVSEQRKMMTLFERIGDKGRIFNREQFKKVEGYIFEFKRHQVRMGCFQAEHRWFLTHGFIKKQDDWPPSQLERANRIRLEHLQKPQVSTRFSAPRR